MLENFPDINRSIITIDCRELLPPEPLTKVLEAVEQMQADEAILMIHRHKPCLLLPKLTARKLKYEMQEFADGSIKLLIWQEST